MSITVCHNVINIREGFPHRGAESDQLKNLPSLAHSRTRAAPSLGVFSDFSKRLRDVPVELRISWVAQIELESTGLEARSAGAFAKHGPLACIAFIVLLFIAIYLRKRHLTTSGC